MKSARQNLIHGLIVIRQFIGFLNTFWSRLVGMFDRLNPESKWTPAQKRAADQGYSAYGDGWKHNPYLQGSEEAQAWDSGFKQGPSGEPW